MGLISRVSSRTYRKKFSKNKMVFNKFVELGRVVYIPGSGISAVVDVVDSRHLLVDTPAGNRRKVDLNNIQLTSFKCDIFHGARTKTLAKAWAAADIDAKWSASTWCKNLEKKALRRSLNDFQRFKLMKLKQAKRQIVNAQLKK